MSDDLMVIKSRLEEALVRKRSEAGAGIINEEALAQDGAACLESAEIMELSDSAPIGPRTGKKGCFSRYASPRIIAVIGGLLVCTAGLFYFLNNDETAHGKPVAVNVSLPPDIAKLAQVQISSARKNRLPVLRVMTSVQITPEQVSRSKDLPSTALVDVAKSIEVKKGKGKSGKDSKFDLGNEVTPQKKQSRKVPGAIIPANRAAEVKKIAGKTTAQKVHTNETVTKIEKPIRGAVKTASPRESNTDDLIESLQQAKNLK